MRPLDPAGLNAMKRNIRRYKVRVLFAEFVSAGIALLGLQRPLLTSSLRGLACRRINQNFIRARCSGC